MKGKWKTKEGKQILIKDMKTSHINNCIAMLQRAYEKVKQETLAAGAYCGNGEMACMAADNAMDEGFEILDAYDNKLAEFENELATRQHNQQFNNNQ